MSNRMAPHYCPYCGDENLVPAAIEGEHAAWECRDCARVFSVKFVGLSAELLKAVKP